jgi:hypothetical protein
MSHFCEFYATPVPSEGPPHPSDGPHSGEAGIFCRLVVATTTRLEVGFMEQTLRRRGGNIREDNHAITVWLTSKWPFAKTTPPLR